MLNGDISLKTEAFKRRELVTGTKLVVNKPLLKWQRKCISRIAQIKIFCFSVVLLTVKPTLIHTDMYVNSIGPVNAINMVSF